MCNNQQKQLTIYRLQYQLLNTTKMMRQKVCSDALFLFSWIKKQVIVTVFWSYRELNTNHNLTYVCIFNKLLVVHITINIIASLFYHIFLYFRWNVYAHTYWVVEDNRILFFRLRIKKKSSFSLFFVPF